MFLLFKQTMRAHLSNVMEWDLGSFDYQSFTKMLVMLNTDLGVEVLSYLAHDDQWLVLDSLRWGLDEGQLLEFGFLLTGQYGYSYDNYVVLNYDAQHYFLHLPFRLDWGGKLEPARTRAADVYSKINDEQYSDLRTNKRRRIRTDGIVTSPSVPFYMEIGDRGWNNAMVGEAEKRIIKAKAEYYCAHRIIQQHFKQNRRARITY